MPDGEAEPLRVDGLYNLVFLLGIMGAVLMSGVWKDSPQVTVLGNIDRCQMTGVKEGPRVKV